MFDQLVAGEELISQRKVLIFTTFGGGTVTLSKYIEEIGEKKFEELFAVTYSTAYKLRTLLRAPSPTLAREIVFKTNGLVTWDDIYSPYFESREKKRATEKVLSQSAV